jgi:hypothetical protein
MSPRAHSWRLLLLEANFVELRKGEVRILGILRSSRPRKMATWQMLGRLLGPRVARTKSANPR